ncbi:MAG TPA: diaminopimelate decarboxylase [Candidatus Brocadiia bacterium]|nr:diaminopimelate decarboxylase [Candidatus Brocadiia bacterium]
MFDYRNGSLYCDCVPIRHVAEKCGTPCYVYSRASFVERYGNIARAFGRFNPLVCFSIKSCSNLSLLKLLCREGSGFDVVSGGEIYRALSVGADPSKIVYAGVGKTADEIRYALNQNILMFNIESVPELEAINAIAGSCGRRARAALRVNPDVDAKTHAKTTTGKKENKFGITLETAFRLFASGKDYPNVELCGVHLHLGSPIYSTEPYEQALDRVSGPIAEARKTGAKIEYINIGGGYCISYTGDPVIEPKDYASALESRLAALGCKLILEPGRYISAPSAALIARIIYRKVTEHGKVFLICDGAMNDLIRPTLYEAKHRIIPVELSEESSGCRNKDKSKSGLSAPEVVDIVGPVCESGDYLGKGVELPQMSAGQYLAVLDAGAYGFSMSSCYNSRPRACEALVEGDTFRVIRDRETCEALVRGEQEHLLEGDRN